MMKANENNVYNNNNSVIIIMAGGLGKRMNSELPKVLHLINKKPMVVHVIERAIELNVYKIIIVVGKFYNIIKSTIEEYINSEYNKTKIFHIIMGILISVLIYYINYFFKVIIETKDVPYLLSVWGPQLILFIIVLINLVKINDK